MEQTNWRICTRCYQLFYYGHPQAGVCPVGGPHSPFGEASVLAGLGDSYDYAVSLISTSEPPSSPGGGSGPSDKGYQGNWRFCSNCYSLFFYGEETAGLCPWGSAQEGKYGGAHTPLQKETQLMVGSYSAGPSANCEVRAINAAPPPDYGTGRGPSDSGYQGNWRFCTKCYCLFYYGLTASVYNCQGGGFHSPFRKDSFTGVGDSGDYELRIAGPGPATPPPPVSAAENQGDHLWVNQMIPRFHQLESSNGEVMLLMQDDGNLVLYQAAGWVPLWASNTANTDADRAVMQLDGNFVVYSSAYKPYYATESNSPGGPGFYLYVQDDHNLVIYSAYGEHMWDTGTTESNSSPPPVPPTLSATAAGDGSFTITGSGFLANTNVTIRATDDYGHFATPMTTKSSGQGFISYHTPKICQKAGGIHFLATDGRQNPKDVTGDLWSNTANSACG